MPQRLLLLSAALSQCSNDSHWLISQAASAINKKESTQSKRIHDKGQFNYAQLVGIRKMTKKDTIVSDSCGLAEFMTSFVNESENETQKKIK